MDFDTIRLKQADGIATLTLDRPDRLNAFTGRMLEEMIAAFDAIDADDAIRAVIVTGAGRAFCAGADLGEGAVTFDYDRQAGGPIDDGDEAARDGGGRLALRIFRCLKPVIAAINGPAVGVGATMTLPMDARLIADGARMGFVFSRRGIVPEACSSYFLPRLVGIAQALEWCFSGRVFPASEALAAGLVKAVVPADALLDTARTLARGFIDGTAPVSVALTRQMLWRGLGLDDPMEAHRIDSRAILSRGRSADVAEGVTAFLDKREPRFTDTVSADMPDFFPWWDERPYR